MPSVSKKQHNLMALVANDPKAAKRLGIKQSVGKEFMSADKGKKFKEGGMMDKKDLAQDKKMAKKAVGMHEKQLHGGKKSNLSALKKGGMCGKKYVGGGDVTPNKKPEPTFKSDVDNIVSTYKKFDDKVNDAFDPIRKITAKAAGKTEKGILNTRTSRGYKSGGMCGKKYARGGGIEVRGKTKGKII